MSEIDDISDEEFAHGMQGMSRSRWPSVPRCTVEGGTFEVDFGPFLFFSGANCSPFFPFVIDKSLPSDEAQFRDPDGRILGRITGLRSGD